MRVICTTGFLVRACLLLLLLGVLAGAVLTR